MTEYGEFVPVDHHRTTVYANQDAWKCACGARGKGDSAKDVYQAAEEHRDEQVEAIVRLISPSQFAAALRLAAEHSGQVASVELLIHHDHWIGYGYLRQHPYVRGGWNEAGELVLRLDWRQIARGCGCARHLVEALNSQSAPYDHVRDLRKWAENDAIPPNRIQGSTSELAILRVACSVAGQFPVNLASDLAGLDNTNRGLVITAISHMLTHGGGLLMRAERTWPGYDNR